MTNRAQLEVGSDLEALEGGTLRLLDRCCSLEARSVSSESLFS